MRALVGMLLLTLGGCDTLWASYITLGDFSLDGGLSCDVSGSCDLAQSDGPPPDLQLAGCSMNSDCSGPVPYCDLNTGQCTAVQPSAEAFPQVPPFMTSITLNRHYVLMATGDYNGDGFTDIAVSGVFNSGGNATAAMQSDVEVYIGDGLGGFKPDNNVCALPGESPVSLITVPAVSKVGSGLLVATFGPNIFYCGRGAGAGGTWTPNMVGRNDGSGPDARMPGFKQLALVKEASRTNPDIIVRTSKNLFLESKDPADQGSFDVLRANANYTFAVPASQASSSGIGWATPVRLKNAAGDVFALNWDDPGTTGVSVSRRGVEFYDTSAGFATSPIGTGYSAPLFMAGQFFPEFTKPFRATTVLHVAGQDPSLLMTVSQQQNYLGVLYGATAPGFTVQAMTTWAPSGLMLPYAGDATGDQLDEIGLYTMALNGNPLTRHLQLLPYKSGSIDTTNFIVDISTINDNFRAMSLDYLGDANDRRRSSLRKDLITLIENPTNANNQSQLVIYRANLNKRFP